MRMSVSRESRSNLFQAFHQKQKKQNQSRRTIPRLVIYYYILITQQCFYHTWHIKICQNLLYIVNFPKTTPIYTVNYCVRASRFISFSSKSYLNSYWAVGECCFLVNCIFLLRLDSTYPPKYCNAHFHFQSEPSLQVSLIFLFP